MSDDVYRSQAADLSVPGSQISGYCLEGLIGRSGMAEVFRARDERFGRLTRK